MRRSLSALLAAAFLAACGGSSDDAGANLAAPSGDFSSLGDDLLIRFVDNPEQADGQCNPNIVFAKRSSDEALAMETSFLVGEGTFAGSSFALLNEGLPGILTATVALNDFNPPETACSEVDVRVNKMICKDADYEPAECPVLRYEGAERFKSFAE